MRLSRLIIKNFRVFPGQYDFDFSNKQLVLIGGQNGHGKSSLFDAIQWCLTGEIRRYRNSREYQTFNYLINEYALSKSDGRVDASVEVWLDMDKGIQKIVRILHSAPSGQTTKININGKVYGVKEGTIKVCEILFRGGHDELPTQLDKTKNLPSYFSTTQLLSQDQLHEFILASNPQERFLLMEKVLGLDKYGSDFVKYLADSLQVVKEEKEKIGLQRQEIKDSWLETATQLKEKESLLMKLGGTTEADLKRQLSSLLESIRKAGLEIPQSLLTSVLVNKTTLSSFSELRHLMRNHEDICDQVLLLLQDTKPLFDLTEEQFVIGDKEYNEQLQALSARIRRRDEGITLGERNRSEMEALIQNRRANRAKHQELDDLDIQIKLSEQNIASIEENPKILVVMDLFQGRERFLEEYIIKEKDLAEIVIKIDINARNITSEQLQMQMEELKKRIADLDGVRDERFLIQERVQSELTILTGIMDSRKQNTINQMIHDIQHYLLEETSESCPVCGTDFKTSDELHMAVRSTWEEASQQLSIIEQEVMNKTGIKNELDRDLYQIDADLRKFAEEMNTKKTLHAQNQLQIEQKRSLLVDWKQDLSLEELNKLKQSIETFVEDHSIAYKLMGSLNDIHAECVHLTVQRSIVKSWIEEQKKLAGKRAHYLFDEEANLVEKIKKIDQYLLQAKAQIEKMERQVKEISLQLTTQVNKWKQQEIKSKEIITFIPEFNKSEPKLESWIGVFYQQKSGLGRLNITTEHLLEKVEAVLSKDDVAKTRNEVERLKKRVELVETEIKNYVKLEEELEELKERHNEIRSTIMTDYLVNYSETIDQLFMQISPHAIFKHVHLVPKEGKLFVLMSENSGDAANWATLSDDELAGKFNASLTFSSAQANVLAVCIFLSLALSQQWTPLQLIGIDDPFQNMDDINVFSFIDVISQVVDRKQVMISSHNEDFVSLIKNKSGLEADKIGYIHFKSYSRDQIDLETNCVVAGEI